jgi:hypothetical protein
MLFIAKLTAMSRLHEARWDERLKKIAAQEPEKPD